jgi:hypothetical protein
MSTRQLHRRERRQEGSPRSPRCSTSPAPNRAPRRTRTARDGCWWRHRPPVEPVSKAIMSPFEDLKTAGLDMSTTLMAPLLVVTEIVSSRCSAVIPPFAVDPVTSTSDGNVTEKNARQPQPMTNGQLCSRRNVSPLCSRVTSQPRSPVVTSTSTVVCRNHLRCGLPGCSPSRRRVR